MNKSVGGLCLIIGTTIGAGMLALPIATANSGLWSVSLLLIGCWALMNAGALLILEANLWCGPDSNLISMARKTLGPFYELLTWLLTLILLYALLCAYIAGGTQVIQHALNVVHLNLPDWFCTLLFTGIMGSVVLAGIRIVDIFNRGLMSIKMLALLLLLISLSPFINPQLLLFDFSSLAFKATTVMMTSFGFSAIIPSLRNYFYAGLDESQHQNAIKQLRLVILIGSTIPLLLYLTWIWTVQSIIPLNGANHSLMEMQRSGNASSHLAIALTFMTQSTAVKYLATLFTSICVLTSFLGVALSLSDFLADGTKISKATIKGKGVNILLCFGPPIIINMLYPSLFIRALSYAGICCLLLLVFIPTLMVLKGRYYKQLGGTPQLKGGRPLLYLILTLALIAAGLSAVGY